MRSQVVLINSVVGIPVVFGLDLFASCTTQVAQVVRARKENESSVNRIASR